MAKLCLRRHSLLPQRTFHLHHTAAPGATVGVSGKDFPDSGGARAGKQPLPSSSPPPTLPPPLPISGLYKPSSLKQLSQTSADSSPEPGILGEGGHLCSRSPLISKWKEVLANRGNPLKAHLASLSSEPPPERRVQAKPGRGCGRCIWGCAWGERESSGPEEEPGTLMAVAEEACLGISGPDPTLTSAAAVISSAQ